MRRSIRPIWRVKVEASQSRTSEGTDSDWMSLSSSSVSTKRLRDGRGEGREVKRQKHIEKEQRKGKQTDAKTKGLLKYSFLS